MAGIMPPQAMAPGQEPGLDDTLVGDEEGLDQATPEEQDAYEGCVLAGLELIYEGGEARPAILKLLDDDPSDLKAALGEAYPDNDANWQGREHILTLAAAATILTLKVTSQVAEETGERPDGVVIFHAGRALLEELAELSEKAGQRAYDESEIGEAFRVGADLFREAAADSGLIDLDSAKEDWDEVVQADHEGRLGEMLPQLADAVPEEEAPMEPAEPRGIRRG